MKILFLLKVVLLLLLLILSVCDIKQKKIPAFIPVGDSILNLTVRFCLEKAFWEYFLCGTGIFLFFWLVGRVTKGQIGSGDALVFLMIGTEFGVMKSIGLVYLSFFLAFLAAVFFFFIKKKGKRYEIPFVPFISLAYLLLLYI